MSTIRARKSFEKKKTSKNRRHSSFEDSSRISGRHCRRAKCHATKAHGAAICLTCGLAWQIGNSGVGPRGRPFALPLFDGVGAGCRVPRSPSHSRKPTATPHHHTHTGGLAESCASVVGWWCLCLRPQPRRAGPRARPCWARPPRPIRPTPTGCPPPVSTFPPPPPFLLPRRGVVVLTLPPTLLRLLSALSVHPWRNW